MFTRKEKQLLHNPYFRVIREEDFFIEVMSVNTKHCWNVFKHITGRGVMLGLYHKHNENDRYYHKHRIVKTVAQAVEVIMSHDNYILDKAVENECEMRQSKRNLKVYSTSTMFSHKEIPMIRLKGEWLRKWGFDKGMEIMVVKEGYGRLTISCTE